MTKENLIFLDTETTGLGAEDRLFQVAYSFQGDRASALFKPPVPISIDSMVITHVTDEMVEKKESFLGSEFYGVVQALIKENILVAHNAKFDAEMLRREGIETESFIDTRKVSVHLDSQENIPKHSLQYLRYYHKLNVDAVAHDALGDVLVLEKLFELLFSQMLKLSGEEEQVLQEMKEISSRPILHKKFTFGKYNGQAVSTVASEDAGYLRWLFNAKVMQRENGEEDDEDWIYTLDYYLNSGKA